MQGDDKDGSVLRNFAFDIAFFGGTAFFVLVSFPAMLLGRGAFRAVVHGWSGWHRKCARWLLGIHVKVEGDLPETGAIIALRHESHFEAIDLPTLLHLPAIFAKAELLRIPLWGASGAAYGLIGVERAQGARTLRGMITVARKYISAGRVLAIFPEGTRIPHGERAPLQSGFAGLYKMLALPVVPVAIDSGPLYQRRWKRAGTITYRVGETIEAGLPRDEIEARVLDAINALNPA